MEMIYFGDRGPGAPWLRPWRYMAICIVLFWYLTMITRYYLPY